MICLQDGYLVGNNQTAPHFMLGSEGLAAQDIRALLFGI
jgi:hypothetical protein